MSEDDSNGRRELVARVATLEMLVADLIHVLWRVDPTGMDEMAEEASADIDIQQKRPPFSLGEPQRELIYSVLESRRRMLRRKKADA